MSGSLPPLPADVIALAEAGPSILVGTCSRELVPDSVRGMGVRIWPGASQLTLLMPAATSATSIANLRENPRIAATFVHVPTHRSVQLKGAVLAIRDGDEADRELAIRYREKLADDLAFVGMPISNTLRLGNWPLHAVDIDIMVVFAQTPGPAAGVKMPLQTGRW